MALNIQGTFETNEGLQVTDLFAFLFFSFDRYRTGISVQYFKSLDAFNSGKDYINVTLPKQFTLNVTPDEFINGNVVLMGHNQVIAAILAANPNATAEIVTEIAPAPPPPPPPVEPEVVSPEVIEPEVVSPEVIEPEVVIPEVVEPPVDPTVTEPEVVNPEVVEPPADTVSDPQ